jgi:alginate O-acetyltransferase complex protein AlgI
MVFASPIFLFLFLPLVFLLYGAALVLIRHGLARRQLRNVVLLAASIVFYTWGEASYIYLILAAIVFNWTVGLAIENMTSTALRRCCLAIGVCGDLSVLAYMKYTNFAVANSNILLSWIGLRSLAIPGVVLPLGVSFFTFHAISYLIDISRKSAKAESNLLNYALYILLFPQLIAGPIIRWKTIFSQFRDRQESYADFRWGMSRFIFGFAKKMLIANPLGHVADQVFEIAPDHLSSSMAWLGLICYTLQIYFDFSGYSDMAIGLMRMFGFHILENFDYPYISRSIREFWRRWHISLSTWFRDYVYIPLGGSHISHARTCLNIMIVFLLSGLWHGANWTFVIWGAWHGFCICLETLGLARLLDRVGPLSHIYGLGAIMLGWVLFRSPDFEHAFGYYGALFGQSHPTASDRGVGLYLDNEVIAALIVGGICSTPVVRLMSAATIRKWALIEPLATAVNLYQAVVLATLFSLSAAAAAAGSYNPFIYFRF